VAPVLASVIAFGELLVWCSSCPPPSFWGKDRPRHTHLNPLRSQSTEWDCAS
jgi:hypothetical protein